MSRNVPGMDDFGSAHDMNKQESKDNADSEPYLENADLHDEYIKALQSEDDKKAGRIQWQIAVANQKLIWWFARKLWRKWSPSCLSTQDLAHYGMFGVLRAVEKYKPEFDTKLSSYAGWWIRRYIESAIFENGPTIRIPEYRINQKAHIDAATLELLENGLEPTLQSIADELNRKEHARSLENPGRKKTVWTPEIVDEVNQTTIHIMSSIDKPVYEDGADNLHSYISDANNSMVYPEQSSSAPFMRKGFRKILESSGLSGRDRLMLELYFYGESHNKNEVSRLFGITKGAFTDILESFEEDFPDIFKMVNARRENLMDILKFCFLPEKNRIALDVFFAGPLHSDTDAAQQGRMPEKQFASVRKTFEKRYPELFSIAVSKPDLFKSIVAFSRLPRNQRAMLGVYFCGDDLTKQDVGVLCGVSRERVRQIVESFTETFKGPLSRLFLRDFVSPREVCEKHISKKYERYARDIDHFFRERGLEKSAVILKQLFFQRMHHKDISTHMGGIPPGTISNRLKRASSKFTDIPEHLAPFFCGGNTGLSPKEIFARQIWDFLPLTVQEEFREGLADEDKAIFMARLALQGEHPKLKELVQRLGKKNAGEVSVALENIIQNFVEFAGEYLKQHDQQG